VPADLQIRAQAALARRMRELVPADRLHAGGAHALALADALVPTLDEDDVRWVHDALAGRAKGELRPAAAGTVQAHAAWSSTALVASAFAAWRARPRDLALGGLDDFTSVRLEHRLPIPHGGGTPNLDVALEHPDGLIGVESKLTEHLAPARPRPWKPAYRRPAMLEALDGGWATTFAALLAGRWTPRHVPAAQLVRHALSLRGQGTLVYLYWEPADAAHHPELRTHHAELDDLLTRVGDARPALLALPWRTVLDGWQGAAPAHVAALRARYDVRVG
jgi:hypothetical protein